jgi:hypothetical protein
LRASEHGGQALGLSAFGLRLLTEHLTPPGAWEARPLPSEPTLCLQCSTPQAIAERWSGAQTLGWQGTIDGAPFAVERGRAGDHRFLHGEQPLHSGALSAQTRAIHHLSSEMGVLSCAPADPAEPSWWRVVLDSVLFTVALLSGYEALHAAAVATPQDGVVAITASMGGGKSTLLSELLRRGLRLMADDVLMLERRDDQHPPLAHPAPPLLTVPTARLAALTPMDPTRPATGACPAPEPICTLPDESWVAFPTHPAPLALRSLVVLDRRHGAGLSLKQIDDPLAPLMGSFLNFPRSPERQRARLELASILAARCTLWRLGADLHTPPEALADALLEGGVL